MKINLWSCDWKRNKQFEKTFKKYSNFVSYQPVDVIAFDGYVPSTKDTTHQKRSGTVFETVEIKNDNPCTSDRSAFFSNKANLFKFLAEKLQKNSFNVIQCPMDAGTTTIKTASAAAKDSPINVFANDTDNLSMPIHHMENNYTDMYNFYMKKCKKGTTRKRMLQCHRRTKSIRESHN